MNFEFSDCYFRYDGKTAVIGNSLSEQKISLTDGTPIGEYLLNKETGFVWTGTSGKKVALCNIPGFDFAEAAVSAEARVDNDRCLGEEALLASLVFTAEKAKATLSFRAFPHNPFISFRITVSGKVGQKSELNEALPEGSDGIENGKEKPKTPTGIVIPPSGSICAFGISEKHLKTREVEFIDVTDVNDTLVREASDTVYFRNGKKLRGHIFYIEAYTKNETLMLVKEAPCASGRLKAEDYDARVLAGNMIDVTASVDFDALPEDCENELYYVTYAAGKTEKLTEDYKDFYRRSNTKITRDGLIRMSNTWGDRNQDAAVKESFIEEEIKTATALGVSALQIDDGWQKGVTANSKLSKGGVWGKGYYSTDENFWSPHPEKFPNGLGKIAEELKKRNIRFALWFSPDSENDYRNWQRDAETLTALYRDYGVCFFKLDGLNIHTMKAENNLVKMLRRVVENTDGNATFDFDVTAGTRWGYVYRKEFGNVFIENRYTDWGNYYPHRTLRNLWCLSKYLPLARFQAEFLNLRRNAGKYGDDIFAPDKFETDYAFAITMFANPLYWFELQNLPERDKEKLSKIAAVHEKISKDIALSDVRPIGEEPDGITYTGFHAKTDEGRGYLLLFRESSENCEYEFFCDLPENAKTEILYRSAPDITVEKTPRGAIFSGGTQKSFVLLEYE